jgi:lysozyme family protein
MREVMLDRRHFLGMLSFAASCFAAGKGRSVAAAESGGWKAPSAPADVALGSIRQRAAGAGLAAPRSAMTAVAGPEYDAVLPQLVDLIASMSEQRARSASPEFDAALNDATELLGALVEAERSPFASDGERAAPYPYEQLRDGYLTLYDGCAVRPERIAITKWHMQTLLDPANRSRYEEVEKRLKIPWYFVGIIHSLEAGFNFRGHLHNGDPLRARTWQVPAGRPKEWNPPTDWVSSATDALAMKNYDNQPDWSIGQMLYRFEKYNGFGYRRRGIVSPYLWSFSNQYTKGKYIADGKWSSEAVSRQCGAALLVKELVAQGAIAAPAKT